jgi:hypothetical protein
MTTPKIWTDSSSALSGVKRIGTGKVRHLEVGYLYTQGLVHAKKLDIGKCKGTENPANILTKHISKPEMEEGQKMLGMIDLSNTEFLESAKDIVISSVNTLPWKPMKASFCFKTLLMISTLVSGVAGGPAVDVCSNAGSPAEASNDQSYMWTILYLVVTHYLLRKLYLDLCWLCRWYFRDNRVHTAPNRAFEPDPEVSDDLDDDDGAQPPRFVIEPLDPEVIERLANDDDFNPEPHRADEPHGPEEEPVGPQAAVAPPPPVIGAVRNPRRGQPLFQLPGRMIPHYRDCNHIRHRPGVPSCGRICFDCG